MAPHKSKKATKWPCGNCEKNCDIMCIYCESCENWYHSKCERITDEELNSFTNIEESYICKKCRTCGSGLEFDFLFGMTRLQKAAESGTQKLEDVCKRESLLIKGLVSIKPQTVYDLEEDPISNKYLEKFTTINNLKAAKSTGNGDCLFNAVSTQLIGDESMSVQLRYRCCLEMTINKDKIKKTRDRASYNILSPSYEQAMLDCAKISSYSSVWTIIALCNVLNIPIRTVYPAVNGSKHDLAVVKFNTTFYPNIETTRFKPKEGETHVTIMWTNTASHTPGSLWCPNHFVPLVPNESVMNIRFMPNPTSSPKTTHDEFKEDKIEMCSFEDLETGPSDSDHDFSSWSLPRKRPRYSDTTEHDFTDSFESRNRFECLLDDSPHEDNDDATTECALKEAPLIDHFMSNENMLQIFIENQQVLKHIPVGQKNNKYVVVENSSDTRRFSDDRGVWDSTQGTTNNQTFLVENQDNTYQLKTLFKRNGKYVSRKRVNGKATYSVLEPQPTEGILSIHRYYTKLKFDNNYKKRITTVTEAPIGLQHLKQLALVEYSGTQKSNNRPVHGNSRHNTQPYIRTNPQTLKTCAEKAKLKPATEVCYEEAKNNSISGPKNAKQIRDKVYREKRKQTSQATSNNNIADEVLNVISQIHTNPYLQKIEMTKHSLPNIIIYSADQIQDMLSNCVDQNGSVIGIDKTFNLGKCFVTCLSYKNQGVVHRDSKENPIMLGPIYLHWDSKEETYLPFFSHFLSKFNKGLNMKIGSDEETAITNNIKFCFPLATQLLCTKHIKDNIRHNLEKNGTCMKDRENILHIIFADGGLVSSNNDSEYFTRLEELEPYFEKYPHFKAYWEKHLKNKIQKNVYEPLRDKKITSLWTNNNSESCNNRIKQATNWKQQKLPELIEKLTTIIDMQHLDLKRSLQGKGNFQLKQHLQKHAVDHDTWCSLTNIQKQEKFQKFLSQNKIMQSDNCFITSSKSKYFCHKPKYHMGKKPGQRRRTRAERTSKFKKR